jgi:hypothetical protein
MAKLEVCLNEMIHKLEYLQSDNKKTNEDSIKIKEYVSNLILFRNGIIAVITTLPFMIVPFFSWLNTSNIRIEKMEERLNSVVEIQKTYNTK